MARHAERRPPLASDALTEVTLELSEMAIAPASLEVAGGGMIEIVNTGAIPHDLVVEGTHLHTPMLDPGATSTLRWETCLRASTP